MKTKNITMTALPSIWNVEMKRQAMKLTEQALKASGGNVTEAARILGISRPTLIKYKTELEEKKAA